MLQEIEMARHAHNQSGTQFEPLSGLDNGRPVKKGVSSEQVSMMSVVIE